MHANGGTESPEFFMTSSENPSQSPSADTADHEPVTTEPEPSLYDDPEPQLDTDAPNGHGNADGYFTRTYSHLLRDVPR